MDETEFRRAVQQLARENEQAMKGVTELQQQFETLIEIAIAMGTLKPGHAALIDKLRRRVESARRGVVDLASNDDKYAVVGEPIDCESRLALCQARCCGLGVVLSRQDIEEGELGWEIDRPYHLRRDADGYCTYLGRDDARCQRYEHRPSTCRSYTCKTDRRVWLDFEARIPAPMPNTLIPPQRLTARRDA